MNIHRECWTVRPRRERGRERSGRRMRKLIALVLVLLVAAAVVCGCAKSTAEKVVARITDNEGKVPPRTVTAGYVNDRLEKMIVPYIPDAPGEEGKRRILEDVIRKELLVIQALRLGLDQHERQAASRELHAQSKAEMMLRAELIDRPGTPTQKEIESYYRVREATFQLLEIAVATKGEADAVYQRVTKGGEDFGRVAREVSLAPSASDEGRVTPIMEWRNYNPLIGAAIMELDGGDVTPPVNTGSHWLIVKVLSRKGPASQTPLEGQHLVGITEEATQFKRSIKQFEVSQAWMAAADAQFDQEALALAATRTDEMTTKLIPDMGQPADTQTRMGRAAVHVVPEFTDEEKGQVLLRHRLGRKQEVITLGDYQEILAGTEGIETPKGLDAAAIERFLRNRMHDQIMAHEIERRGYLKSSELKQYVAERAEELMVHMLYEAEVTRKVADPLPIEVREYYEAHRGEFAEPPSVDVQHVVVKSEALANSVRQQLTSGQVTFDDVVQRYATSGWLRANKGIVTSYYKGEQRFAYIQEPAFRLAPGEISEPVAAPGGFAIVKVLKQYPERYLTLDEAGRAVEKVILAQRRDARLNQLLDEIRGSVTIEIVDKNLQYVRDTAEVLREKKGAAGLITAGREGQ